MPNWQVFKFVAGNTLTSFADRIAQLQLFSLFVIVGPDGQGLGDNTLALFSPFAIFGVLAGLIWNRFECRRIYIALAILRTVFALAVPTFLSSSSTPLSQIPIFIFVLSSIIAVSSVGYVYFPPTITSRLRQTNSLALLGETAGTVLALLLNLRLSGIWLPNEMMRLSAIVYLLSLMLFWLIKAPKAVELNETGSKNYKAADSRDLFTASLLILTQSTFWLWFLLSLCIQNIQLNNGNSLNLCLSLCSGITGGALIFGLNLLRIKSLSKIWLGATLTACLCAAFGAAGTFSQMKSFITLIGTTGAFTFLAIETLMQRLNRPHGAKMFGVVISIQGLIITLLLLCVNHLAASYTALTLVRILALAFAGLTAVTFVTNSSYRAFLLPRKKDV